MNPRDQLAKEFLVAFCSNPQYVASPTPALIAMAYEVTDAFLNRIDLSCPGCGVKPGADGKIIHQSGCTEGWPE